MIKPCPFCESPDVQILENNESCWVNCMTCFADGPPHPIIEKAIARWNAAPRPQEILNDNFKRS